MVGVGLASQGILDETVRIRILSSVVLQQTGEQYPYARAHRPWAKGAAMARMSLAKLSTVALKKELQRRLEALPKLIAQRDELNQQIAEIEGVAAAEECPKPTRVPAPKKRARRAKRAKSAVSLASTLAEAIKAKETMSVAEAAEAALAAGYKSKSKDFSNLVNMTLASDKRFERVARGVYRVRS